MSGRLVNVRPKPGFVLDHSGAVVPRPANVSLINDGALLNVLTGRGMSVDRSAHNFWMRRFQGPQQVEAAYLGSWLHRKIVDIPAEDMTRAGRDWDATDDEIEKIEAEERRLGYWAKVREALRLGRLGGGAIFIGLDGDDPEQPLPGTVKAGAVKYLLVLSRWQLQLGDLDSDPASPSFNQPRYFRISGLSQQFDIHPSRMVCFHGLPVPAISQTTTTEDMFWGMSVVEAVDEAVQQATTACEGFASLIDEAKVDVFTMPGMYETLSQPGGEDKFMTALAAAARGKSIHRMLALGEGETWETRQLVWAGMPDVIRTYMANVAGAADIPATRLLGKSPDGQNATGESDLANYYQSIGAKQEMNLRPAMERLDAVVLPSAGVADTGLSWTFSPLRVLSEKEQAEIEFQEAQTVEKMANSGLLPETALAKSVQNRLIESQRWPGLQDAIAEAEAAGEDLPEDDPELGIVPVEEQQATPANDAAPRSLYVSRKVKNVAEIKAWARSQGLPELQDDLHVTIAWSRTPIDWMKAEEDWPDNDKGELVIKPGGPRLVEPLGDRTAVLLFASSHLSYRHERIRQAGASWDFDDYQPHISLTGEPVDLSNVEPYRGRIVLGPEVFEEVRSEGDE